MARWTVPRMWEGGECWIIAGGLSMPIQFDVPDTVIDDVCAGRQKPAVYSPYLSTIHNKHVIGVNNAYQIGSWIDIVFFGDCAWYRVHRRALGQLATIKVTCCNRFENRRPEEMEGIKYLAKDPEHRHGITGIPSKVAWNANSGAAAISLAVHTGATRIILLGFDMNLTRDISHWHGSHGNKNPPPFARHLRGFSAIAEDAKRLNVEIINASPNSAIKDFPKVSVKDLLKSNEYPVSTDNPKHGDMVLY